MISMDKMKRHQNNWHLNIFLINIINDFEVTPMYMVKSTHIDIIKSSWTRSTIKA